MDLVHKEDVILVEVGEQRRQVPRLLNGGAGGDADVDPHLVGYDAREGGLAQARGAVEQDMVQGLTAHFGRLDEHLQVGLGLLLPDVLPQGLGRRDPSFSSAAVREVVTRARSPPYSVRRWKNQ